MPFVVTKILLVSSGIFFLFEFFLHLFGLPILEHDIIYKRTHDGYIAVLALTFSMLQFYVAIMALDNPILFFGTMIGVLLMFINAWYISVTGGYKKDFPVKKLDRQLTIMGYMHVVWWIVTVCAWYFQV